MPDSADTTEGAPDKQHRSHKKQRKFLLQIVAVVVILALIGWTGWYYAIGRWQVSTDDSYVSGNMVQISSKVAGTLVSIHADEGDLVKAGQVLAELDPNATEIELDAAKAGLAEAVRNVAALFSNAEAARANMEARQADLALAQANFSRTERLAKAGVNSGELLDEARATLLSAQSALAAAEQTHDAAQALISGTNVADNPAVKVADARLRAAYLDHVHTRLLAPIDGHVTQRRGQVGEYVTPGEALMAVVPLRDVWVDANFKETQIRQMRIGQPVRLVSDLYGGSVPFHGTVEALGIGTGSAFSLLPAENATGNWIKIVQRLPVRIKLDPDELKEHPLRIGLSMKATVDLHDTSGAVLAQQPPAAPVLITDVYKNQLRDAAALVDDIIRNNLSNGKGSTPAAP